MSGNMDWYEHAESYWHEIPGTEYLIRDETEEIYPVFLGFLEDVNLGYAPEASENFWELLEYFGWSYDQFDWDEFRDWYDGQ